MPHIDVLSQAIEHVPGLLLIWLTIYGTYWFLGLAKWPNWAWREAILERFGRAEVGLLGFRLSSLAIISLISLFLELLLIRWIASEVRVFAYFKSLVLIACFLGFGVGCYLTRRPIRLAYTFAPLLALVWVIELPWDPVRRLIINLSGFIGWFSDVHIWGRAYFADSFLWGAVSAGVAMSIVIPMFGLIAVTFVPFGQLVGWYLENSTKGLLAYSINIVASVVGIWLYTVLCFMSTPPEVWFAFFGLGLLVYFWRLPRLRSAVLVWCVTILAMFGLGTQRTQWWGEQDWKGSLRAEYTLEPGKIETLWSPYQKLTVVPLKRDEKVVRYILKTNDSWYQQILDLSDRAIAEHPELYEGTNVRYHQYNLPYRFYNAPPKVFIAGAGMGNDVAAALRNGAKEVTAVEIDPLIYAKGKELHLEAPYRSNRVRAHVEDARTFVQNARERFDLVVFSILDSHTTSSYYTNIRLDNYVYTLEAMEATKRLLNPDGLFVMSFSGDRPWFTKRLRDVVARAFDKEPLIVRTNVSFFVVGPGTRAEVAVSADPELREFVRSHPPPQLEAAELTTDDWPYLYQQHRGIPIIVWLMSIGLIAVCWRTFGSLKQSSEGIRWHFFFLGAAFMLLEVQNLSKAALLFGTTWLVNSIVITGLLLFILVANQLVSWFPGFPMRLAYAGLFVTLAASFLVPVNALLYDSVVVRALAGAAVYCSPVLFAGLIFASSFQRVGLRAEAFGSNLLGSLVGGLLDSASYLIGIKALVLVAGLLYLLSLVTMSGSRVEVAVASDAPAR